MRLLFLLALALAPVVFLFTFVYLRDKHEKEPLKYLIITFLLGVITAAPVIFLGQFLSEWTGTSSASSSIIDLLIYSFLVVALTEEGLKYIVLRWYNYPHQEFDEPYDGIMYGVAVSLGFAAIENVLYVFSAAEDSVSTALWRMFTAVPAHAMFGVMMGYFVGKAKFLDHGLNAYFWRMVGLFVAIFFHGTYDYFLFLGHAWLAGITFLTLIIGLYLATKAMHLHAEISPHRTDQFSEEDILG